MMKLKKLKEWWTKINRWADKYDDDDDKTGMGRLEGDLYEDVREEVSNKIIENKKEAMVYERVAFKIKNNRPLTIEEQKISGIIQIQ